MKRIVNVLFLALIVSTLFSCDSFLDIVPDDTATIQKSFKMRNQAKKALYACYHYLPKEGWARSTGGFAADPAFASSAEFWIAKSLRSIVAPNASRIDRGQQSVVNPAFNYWGGGAGGINLYQGIRVCNTFLANISKVGNMEQTEKEQWSAEVKFLKAYYYFLLTRMYGPIILNKHNIPVDASKSEINTVRAPVDSSFSYVIKLLNEVINTSQLPARVTNTQQDLGRITKSIAYAIRAKVWITWASPLFNGNKDYTGFTNKKEKNPFATKYYPSRWDSAAAAAKEAIDYLDAHNFHLYYYESTDLNPNLDDTTRQKMTIRNSFTFGSNKINPSVIWPQIAIHGAPTDRFRAYSIAGGLNNKNANNTYALGCLAPPLKTVELFYTNHGLPIKKDKTWDYSNRLKVQTINHDQRYNLKEGYNTAKLNMHRSPRFYADLGFDGNIWYGNGIYKQEGVQKYHYIKAKKDQINWYPVAGDRYHSATGYWVKKLLNYKTQLNDQTNGASFNFYNWPKLRLSDIYLLYAEAKNETDGPGAEVFKYLNKVRVHDGLPTVQKAWTQWSTTPNQYKTKEGLRTIIHRERSLALMFEGKRYWDLRRWKELLSSENKPIEGWDRSQSKAGQYYVPQILANPQFSTKDYLFPISENTLTHNDKLTQNPGWGR